QRRRDRAWPERERRGVRGRVAAHGDRFGIVLYPDVNGGVPLHVVQSRSNFRTRPHSIALASSNSSTRRSFAVRPSAARAPQIEIVSRIARTVSPAPGTPP